LAKPISTERLYRRIVGNIERPKRFIRVASYFGPDRRTRPRGERQDDTGTESAEDIAWIGDPGDAPGLPGGRF